MHFRTILIFIISTFFLLISSFAGAQDKADDKTKSKTKKTRVAIPAPVGDEDFETEGEASFELDIIRDQIEEAHRILEDGVFYGNISVNRKYKRKFKEAMDMIEDAAGCLESVGDEYNSYSPVSKVDMLIDDAKFIRRIIQEVILDDTFSPFGHSVRSNIAFEYTEGEISKRLLQRYPRLKEVLNNGLIDMNGRKKAEENILILKNIFADLVSEGLLLEKDNPLFMELNRWGRSTKVSTDRNPFGFNIISN